MAAVCSLIVETVLYAYGTLTAGVKFGALGTVNGYPVTYCAWPSHRTVAVLSLVAMTGTFSYSISKVVAKFVVSWGTQMRSGA